jgi:hypothetical protein
MDTLLSVEESRLVFQASSNKRNCPKPEHKQVTEPIIKGSHVAKDGNPSSPSVEENDFSFSCFRT